MSEIHARHRELLCWRLCFPVIRDLHDKGQFLLALSFSHQLLQSLGLMMPTPCAVSPRDADLKLETPASMAPSEQQCFCHVDGIQARKTWKGDAILHLPKTQTDVTSVGWSDFLPWNEWIQSISGAQKEKRFKDQRHQYVRNRTQNLAPPVRPVCCWSGKYFMYFDFTENITFS